MMRVQTRLPSVQTLEPSGEWYRGDGRSNVRSECSNVEILGLWERDVRTFEYSGDVGLEREFELFLQEFELSAFY